jgi:hypothetical protein
MKLFCLTEVLQKLYLICGFSVHPAFELVSTASAQEEGFLWLLPLDLALLLVGTSDCWTIELRDSPEFTSSVSTRLAREEDLKAEGEGVALRSFRVSFHCEDVEIRIEGGETVSLPAV